MKLILLTALAYSAVLTVVMLMKESKTYSFLGETDFIDVLTAGPVAWVVYLSVYLLGKTKIPSYLIKRKEKRIISKEKIRKIVKKFIKTAKKNKKYGFENLLVDINHWRVSPLGKGVNTIDDLCVEKMRYARNNRRMEEVYRDYHNLVLEYLKSYFSPMNKEDLLDFGVTEYYASELAGKVRRLKGD